MAESKHPLQLFHQNDRLTKVSPRKSTFEYEVYKELESDEYGCQILSRFNEFREEGKFCDVTLIVEELQFKVHKMVLAGCSDYFKALFMHGMKDSNMDMFDLPEISLRGFKPLLQFTYTGKLKVNFDILPDVLSVATFLQMRPAIKLCQIYLKAIMSLEDSDEIVNLGMNYGLTELREAQRRLILDHFFEFSETRKFYETDSETLIDYLQDDTLRIKSEGTLLKCILRWYKYDRPQRDEDIAKVLQCIRYVQNGWPIIEFAEKEEPFTTNKKCKRLLNFCAKYMEEPHRKHLTNDFRTRVRYDHRTLIQLGGMVNANAELTIEFPFLGNIANAIDNEKVGSGRNLYYHKSLGKWIPMGCIGESEMRSHCPLVYVNDHCIHVGGYVYTQDYSQIYQHCTNEVHVITPTESEFSMWDMPYMNETRAHHCAVATPTFIYAIGGKNESGSLKTVEQFHMDTEIWSFIKPLPEALCDHAGAAIGEDVYVTGGLERGVIVKETWMYNYVQGTWEEKPPMLFRRAGHTMTHLNGQLIVCGGHTNSDSMRCLNSVESFNVELQQWSIITPMLQDCANMSAAVLDETLVVLGGMDSAGELLKTVQQYDVKQKCWSNLCELPVPMQNAGVCALTVKLTDNGERETDSLCDEYEKRILPAGLSDEEYAEYHSHSDDEAQAELMV